MPKRRMLLLAVSFFAAICVFVSTGSAVAATAANSCGQQAATRHRSSDLRGLSSAQTEVRALCAEIHWHNSTLNFINHRQWLVAPHYSKWWNVPGKKHRLMVRKFRALERWHKQQLARNENKLEAYAEELLYLGNVADWTCIHHGEGAWNSNTGNGYYGGLQMDMGFQETYGAEYLARYGTADKWPIRVQIAVAQKAHDSGRGYGPWPRTALACGLI